MVEKLIARMIKNIHIEIKKIHVRYEDHISFKDHPFSVGFTLSTFTLESCTDSWETTGNLKDMYAIPQIYKVSCQSKMPWKRNNIAMKEILQTETYFFPAVHVRWFGSVSQYNRRTI